MIEAGMISVSKNLILLLLDYQPYYTDRFGFEGVILGYGLYDIWTEERKLAGELKPDDTRENMIIHVNRSYYYSSFSSLRSMLVGEAKISPVIKKN